MVGERAGLDAPASSTWRPAARRKPWSSRCMHRPARRWAIARATSCSRPGRAPSTSAGGATSSARASPSRTRGTSRPGAGSGATRARAPSSCSSTAGPPGPAGSGLPRVYPGREQLWSFIVPRRRAQRRRGGRGLRRAADPARPRREPPRRRARAALERQSLPRDLRPLRARERAARPGPRALLRHRRDAAGPHAGPLPPAPLDQRPHAARDHAGPARHSGAPRMRCASACRPRQRRQRPGRHRARRRHPGGRLGLVRRPGARARRAALEPGRHRLEISASDLQETKNSENASALALPNTRIVHTAFTVRATG